MNAFCCFNGHYYNKDVTFFIFVTHSCDLFICQWYFRFLKAKIYLKLTFLVVLKKKEAVLLCHCQRWLAAVWIISFAYKKSALLVAGLTVYCSLGKFNRNRSCILQLLIYFFCRKLFLAWGRKVGEEVKSHSVGIV